jgi:hypothetical protein
VDSVFEIPLGSDGNVWFESFDEDSVDRVGRTGPDGEVSARSLGVALGDISRGGGERSSAPASSTPSTLCTRQDLNLYTLRYRNLKATSASTTLQEASIMLLATQEVTRTCTKAQGLERGGPRARGGPEVIRCKAAKK